MIPPLRNARLARPALLGLVTLGVAACGGTWRGSPERELVGTGIHSSNGATVVTAEELHRYNGSVLRAIMSRVPNMRVEFDAQQRCPAIALRRSMDHRGYNVPDVYVDGTRAQNTCVLEGMRAYDVDRVEIYPQGFTTRPGYGTSTHGLILVFTRRT